MGARRIKINKINHLAAWLAWALFYCLYNYFVAVRVPFHWPDYIGFLVIHVGSFYFSVFLAFPFANPNWNRFNWRTGVRLALVVLLEVIAIPVLVSVLSIVVGALNMGLDTSAQPEANVLNFLDVVVFLYSGLIFALFYLGFAKLEGQRDELIAEVERLRVQLSESENANLEQSLIPHLYANLLGVVNDAVRRQPGEASYMVNIFNQIVRFYGRLGPGELIPMADEIAICELFLEITEAKLGRKPAIKFEIEEDARQLKVLPMLVMLLMENLDKYGVLDDDGEAVRIYIGLRLGHLIIIARNTVKVREDVPPFSTKKGIRSIKERLDARQLPYAMYNDVRNGHFSFVLVINFE